MLKTLLNLNEEKEKESKVIKEQEDSQSRQFYTGGGGASFHQGREETAFSNNNERSDENDSDYAVINDVEIVVHSEDPEDLELNDEEKGKISQLIDDFRTEVIETAEFDKMDIYEASAKLTGTIREFGISFTLSTGDDTGLYINTQMAKIDENSLDVIEKLKAYESKYSATINDLLVRRKTT